jgi:pSer/pThr/pTyr-binding forkhead associated (FHA) protein
MKLILFEKNGLEKETSVPLTDKITIGRDSSNNFQLLDDSASRFHARIDVQKNNKIIVEDLQSTNGTFVNEKRITKKTIRAGDEIRIGKTVLVIKKISGKKESPQSQPFTVSSDATSNLTKAGGLTCPKCSKAIKAKWEFCAHCGGRVR